MMDNIEDDIEIIGIPGTEDKVRKGYNTVGLFRWCKEHNINPTDVSYEFIAKHFMKKKGVK